MSYVCGNEDDTSWCGSDGSAAEISFYSPTTGKKLQKPFKIFYWNGKELVI